MEESENLRRATDLWRAAYRYQMEGELDRAVEHYPFHRGVPHGRGAVFDPASGRSRPS